MFKIKNIKKSKLAAVAIGTAVKVLTAVVCGAVVLTGTYGVVKHTVLPTSTAKTKSMFAYEGGADTGGGSGGSAGDNPVYETEIKRLSGETVPEGAKYTKADGTVLTSFPDAPATGDTYEEGDYIYSYNKGGDYGTEWSVVVKDTRKTSYGKILSNIAEKPLTYMTSTFEGCIFLTEVPNVPNSVTNMRCTFKNCSSLSEVKIYSNSVKEMYSTFLGASVKSVILPAKVERLDSTFMGCTIKNTPVIPDTVISMNSTFWAAKMDVAPAIPDKVSNMYGTFAWSTIKKATTIPSSVTYLNSTFWYCTELEGEIIINADVSSYPFETCSACFSDTKKTIVLKGTCTNLSDLATTAANGNVTIG